MKIQITKASALQIEPGKKYLVIINIDEGNWTKAQQADLKQQLEPIGITVVYLPKGSKFKMVEAGKEE